MSYIPFKSLLYFVQQRCLKTLPTISTSLSSSPSFTVQYLVNSCGLSLENALSASQKLQLDEKKSELHESVLAFLKSQEFSDAHIAKLIAKYPGILQSKIHTKVMPKIRYLTDHGFSGSLLPELIVANPVILRRGLSSHLKPSLDFLKIYLTSKDKLIAAVKRASWLLTFDLKGTMQPNIDLLISEGVPIGNISKLIIAQPRVILQKVDSMANAVEAVKKMGVEPPTPMFIHALRVKVSMSEPTWNRKVEVFKSLGWSEEEIKSAFRRDPLCLSCSDEKIKSIMDFYVNTMKLEPEVIIAYPKLLMYSLETRIRPRYNVVKVLLSKKLLKEDRKLAWVLTLNEKRFLEDFVIKHLDNVPNLMELYHHAIPASKMIFSSKEVS